MKMKRLPLFPLLLTICLGWGYLSTLLPGIGYSGDAIKFQYLGKVLGIPHAPGYPLYLVLNHLFVSFFPFGSLANKANLLSAIYALGACLVLFKLLKLLDTGGFVAFVVALSFGFSQAFWSQAVVAEVYSLLVLFMVSVSYFLVSWHLKRHDRDFYIATALYALSFGNHLLAITLLPAFVYLVAVTDRRVFVQPKKVLWVLLVVVLGAAQYGYLFWRLGDPETPYIEGFNGQNFFYFVTGGPFKPQMFAFTLTEIIGQRIPSSSPLCSEICLSWASPLWGRFLHGLRSNLCAPFYLSISLVTPSTRSTTTYPTSKATSWPMTWSSQPLRGLRSDASGAGHAQPTLGR